MRSVIHTVSDWGIVEGQDIKPDNLLLSESGIVKLSDFGLKKWYIDRDFDGSSICIVLLYLAPEVFEDDAE